MHKSNPRCIYLITAVVVILCAAANRCELFIYNLYMISAGLLGMAVGIVRRDNIEKVNASNSAILSAWGGCWIMNGMLPEAYITQLYAALAVVAAIFAFAIKLNSNRMLFRQVVLLGQYSLFSYIIQIVILQVYLRLIAVHIRMEYSSYGIVVITMTAMMVWGAVTILDKMRRQSEKIDTLYRSVFA